MSVESGLILWSAAHAESVPGGRGDLSRVVAAAAKAIAGDFPDKNERARTAEEDKAERSRAATVLKSAQNLEKVKKPEAALEYYRQVVKDFPETPRQKPPPSGSRCLPGSDPVATPIAGGFLANRCAL